MPKKRLCTLAPREPFSGAGSRFREPGAVFRELPLRGPFSGAAPESLEPLFEAVPVVKIYRPQQHHEPYQHN